MLIRLLPEQASNHWDEIKFAIEESLPPIVGMQSDRMSNILRSVLLEEVIVWVSHNSEKKVDGLVLTTFVLDKLSGTKSLLIYCLYGYGTAGMESWQEGVETLRKFAISSGCHRVTGYTDVPSIIRFVESIGGTANYRFISIPLEKLHESIH